SAPIATGRTIPAWPARNSSPGRPSRSCNRGNRRRRRLDDGFPGCRPGLAPAPAPLWARPRRGRDPGGSRPGDDVKVAGEPGRLELRRAPLMGPGSGRRNPLGTRVGAAMAVALAMLAIGGVSSRLDAGAPQDGGALRRDQAGKGQGGGSPTKAAPGKVGLLL